MFYKGVKYNIIVVFLMVIIGVIGATSTGMLSTSTDGDSIFDNPTDDEEVIDDGGENPNTSGFVMPGADANAYERLTFAFKVLKEGAGFKYTMNQEVNSVGMVQKVYIQGYRSGKTNLIEEWHDADFAFGSKKFVSYYGAGQGTIQKKILNNTRDFSYDNKSYNYAKADEKLTMTEAQYNTTFKGMNENPITLNASTTTLTKYDKRSDPNFYIIKLDFLVDKVDREYISTFEANGASNVKFQKIAYEIKISKKTGYLSRMFTEQAFTTSYAMLNNIDCTSRSLQIFSNVNKSAQEDINTILTQSVF